MTLDEAKRVAAIMNTADSGCVSCVLDLLGHMAREFGFRISVNGRVVDPADGPLPTHPIDLAFERIEVEL